MATPSTETATEGKGKKFTGKTKAEKKPESPPVALVTVKASAISAEVGPAVIAGFAKAYQDEQKANELIQGVNAKRYDLLSQLTLAIVKAAKNDNTIDLSVTFGGKAKEMNVLNDQLGLALGFREVIEVGDKQKIGYAKAVAKFFPQPKDDKKSQETIRKATLRSNFLHAIKKCAQAASAIVEKDINVAQDKASGTLKISGPAVKAQFGQDSVLLNEKLNIGDGENTIKLKEKPSFTALAKLGAEASGQSLTTRKDSRVSSNAVDPDTALQSLCNSLVAAISKLQGKPNAKTIESFNSVKSAIDKVTK